MAVKDFKVRKGLFVGDSATIGTNLTVGGNSVVTGNMTVSGTANITGGLTGAYGGFDSDFSLKNTADLTEHNTKLYYTTARVDSAITVKVDSAFLDPLTPTYIRTTRSQTLTNKTIVDPIIDSTPMFGQQFGGVSFNMDTNLGDSTQALLSFISKDSLDGSGLVLGVKNQQNHIIGTRGNSASNKLVIGLDGTNSQINIIRNVGKNPVSLSPPSAADDLITISNTGRISTNDATEAATQTSGSIVTVGGIGAGKNIRGEDIIAASNVKALAGELQGTLSAASLGTRSTTDLPEGTNLYYLDTRVDSYINASIFTTDVTEGSNLYYTTSRADSAAKRAISVSDGGGDGSMTYNNSTGVISYVGPSPAEVRSHFSQGTGVTLSGAGQISIGQPVGTSDSVQFNAMSVNNDVVVYGNLTVAGTQTSTAQADLSVSSSLIKVADSNSADTVDIGVVGRYSQDGGTTIRRTGFVRDATNGEWYVFDNLIQNGIDSGTAPFDTTININDTANGYRQPTWNFGKLRGSYLGFDSDFAAFSSNYVVYTTDFTAVNAGRYALNTSGGSFVVTLPANPQTGDYVKLIDVANFSTNSVTVNRNGSTIEGFAENFVLDLGQSIIEFIYINSNWQIYTSIGQRGPKGDKGDSADASNFSTRAQTIAFSVALG